MKTSISVPDDLWSQARMKFGLDRSDLVQAVFRHSLETRDPWADSDLRPADVTAEFAAVQKQLAVHARQEFERGYRAALQVAPKLPWSAIEGLAERHAFNVKEWATQHRNWAGLLIQDEVYPGTAFPPDEKPSDDDRTRDYDLAVTLSSVLGRWAYPWDDPPPPPTPGETFIRGFAQAFRDLWASMPDAAKSVVPEEEVVSKA